MNQQQDGVVQKADPFQDNKPRFLIKPISLRVDRGEDAAFSCKLSGEPLPQVVWEKDGKQLNEIYESSHYHVGQQDNGWFQLKIFRTRAPDGGVYMCKAVNTYGEAMTGAVLLVEPVPEQRQGSQTNGYTNGHYSPHQSRAKHSKEPHLNVSKAKKFTVTEGKHAKFRCYVTGKPKPEIVWKKDGENIVPGRRFIIFEDREGYYTLKLLYCKQQDTGLYICAASNTLGNTLSAVQLSVKGNSIFDCQLCLLITDTDKIYLYQTTNMSLGSLDSLENQSKHSYSFTKNLTTKIWQNCHNCLGCFVSCHITIISHYELI